MIHNQYGSYGQRFTKKLVIIRQNFGHHSPKFWSSFAKGRFHSPKFWSEICQNFGHHSPKVAFICQNFSGIICQNFGLSFAKILVASFTKILVASSDIFKELLFERI